MYNVCEMTISKWDYLSREHAVSPEKQKSVPNEETRKKKFDLCFTMNSFFSIDWIRMMIMMMNRLALIWSDR